MKKTVICHFWNNEWIMPYWLRHHTALFDHGILIDHGASDRTVDIIKELAPGWEVRRTQRCKDGFIATETDIEVMEIEQEIPGWKMALNVTEFLIVDNLDHYIQRLGAMPGQPRGVTTSGVVLVENPHTRYDEVTQEPLFFQKTHGYFEYELGKTSEDHTKYGIPGVYRSRLLHCYPHGNYETGRHITHVEHIRAPNLFLAWTGWAPYEQIKHMKFAVQTRIPESEFSRGLSVQHKLQSLEELDRRLQIEQTRSHSLLADERYVAALTLLGYGKDNDCRP